MRRPRKKEADSGWRLTDSQSASAPPPSSVDPCRERDCTGVPDSQHGGEDKHTEIAAVRLLARREHSTRELKRKLQGKGHDPEIVERVVNKLSDKQLVSDERFATSFVAHHGRRGHGPIRIRAELRQQGATDEAIESALSHSDLDWAEIAAAVRVRKFGSEPPSDRTERAKQSRFLQYRGFSADHIRAAFSGSIASTVADDPSVLDPDWS